MINSKTIALLFAMFSLGGMIAIPGLSLAPTTTAYAQLDIPLLDEEDFPLDIFEEEEDADNTQTIEQPIEQDIEQEVDQEEENEQDNDNTQTQTGAVDQDIAQGLVDGDDEAESESESGDARGEGDSSSSSSSGNAENVNIQEAENVAELNQDQQQDVDQDNVANFGDDTADLDAVNVAIPIAVPINVQEEDEVVEVPDDEVPPPGEEDAFFCFPGEGELLACFESLAECQEAAATIPGEQECQRVETLPEGANICTVENGQIFCEGPPV